ncbi:MAG: ImmA/IrrE family metallo-endopeptidase [Rhodocyclaceae bacterium]|nr:ImmA/IrrE family metallo-endopeptidase [Rhodocyclaceae bacterium]
MKMVRDTTGRFAQRPHYEPSELDRECEQIVSNYLRRKHGHVVFPLDTDDLTALIEQESEDLDLYADLSDYGEGVEGVTIFAPGGKPSVKIARELSEATSQNRLRTSLSHEFGHVHFHSYLFDTSLRNMDLFANDQASRAGQELGREQVCKRDSMVNAAQSDWMEWQAGHVCGAMLMPVTVLKDFLQEEFSSQILSAGTSIDAKMRAEVINVVASYFLVSKEAATVRLLRLKFLPESSFTPSL